MKHLMASVYHPTLTTLINKRCHPIDIAPFMANRHHTQLASAETHGDYVEVKSSI